MVLSGYSYIFMIHSISDNYQNRAIASLIYINERFLHVYSFLIKTMFLSLFFHSLILISSHYFLLIFSNSFKKILILFFSAFLVFLGVW